MKEDQYIEFVGFLKRGRQHGYTGDGTPVVSMEPDVTSYRYEELPAIYTDDFSGHYVSSGSEVIRYEGKRVWELHYGGGMSADCTADPILARETFRFLKEALRVGLGLRGFQPRGPSRYEGSRLVYRCNWNGNLQAFNGVEEIFDGNILRFSYRFFGFQLL